MTAEEIKAKFQKQGITITEWAKERNYHREMVYRVLNGTVKAKYGKAHQIAVELGLKNPVTE